MLQKTSCLECRHGTFRQQRTQVGKNEKGVTLFDYVPKYMCGYHNITHGVDQISCKDYIGNITVFEYLAATHPQALYDVLSKFSLKVVSSGNKYGFDIVTGEDDDSKNGG